MELKENEKNNNSFPINISNNNKEKKVNEIIKDFKQKEKENKKKKRIQRQKEKEENMEE